MKTFLAIIVLLLLGVIVLGAQGAGFGMQSPQQSLASAPVPAVGLNTIFSGPDAWYIANGATPLVKLAPGAPGPQGLPGVKGDTGAAGPQGLPGTSGSFPASACVGGFGPDVKGNTVITFIACK